MKNCLFLLWLPYCFCDDEIERIYYSDDTAKIERPCGAVYDVNCVREFISEHAQCKKTYGPAPDPIYRIENNLYVPFTNMTFTVINQEIGGINGRIDEFYINRDTDNLVITVEFRDLSMTSNNSIFQFHRLAKEPVVTSAFATVLYTSVLITAVIPKIDDLQLDKAEYVAYVNDPVGQFFIGPTAAVSSDPQVQLAVTRLLTDLPTSIQELFLTDATYYLANYIQYNICDFGLKIE